MSNNVLTTKAPIVLIEQAELAAHLDVSGLGDFQIVPFERQIFWIREAQALVRWVRNGKVLRTGPAFNDYRGYLSSVEGAVDAALALMREEGISPSSEVALEVVLTVTDTPAVIDLSPQAREYASLWKDQLAYLPIEQPGGGRRIAYAGGGLERWAAERDVARKMELHEEVRWVKPVVLLEQAVWDSREQPSLDEMLKHHRGAALSRIGELIAQRDALEAQRQDRRMAV